MLLRIGEGYAGLKGNFEMQVVAMMVLSRVVLFGIKKDNHLVL